MDFRFPFLFWFLLCLGSVLSLVGCGGEEQEEKIRLEIIYVYIKLYFFSPLRMASGMTLNERQRQSGQLSWKLEAESLSSLGG